MAGSVYIEMALQVSRAKVEWTAMQMYAVRQHLKQIQEDNKSLIKITTQPGGKDLVSIAPVNGIYRETFFLVGDILHNLNGVTDYLWSGLAKTCDPEKASKVTFPRHQQRSQLEHSLNAPSGINNKILAHFPEAKRFLLEYAKPYKSEDAPSLIWHLNKLDNINKHRLILMMSHFLKFDRAVIIKDGAGSTVNIGDGVGFVTDGTPYTISMSTPAKVVDEPQAIVDIVFAEQDHFNGKPVIETIETLSSAVSQLINDFETVVLK